MNAYSHLKPFRHPDILHSIQTGSPARPAHVELILADACQQHCSFCAYRLPGYASNQLFNDKNMMDLWKALEIVQDCKDIGVQAVQFTGGGEPTLHRGFPQVFSTVIDNGMKAGLVSNGVRIDVALADILAKAAWVRISLDASTEETYCKIRRVHSSHWQKAQAAIVNLKAAGCPQVGVGFVVTPDNWTEILGAAELAKSLGADNFRISAMFSNEDERLFATFHKSAALLAQAAEELSDARFTVYNRFSDRLDDLRLGKPSERLCGYQFFTTYIGADLNVYRCCGYAYNRHGLIGSLRDRRFRDFWLSEERINNQLSFDGRGCERCQFRRQNEAIQYSVQPQLHEEFV